MGSKTRSCNVGGGHCSGFAIMGWLPGASFVLHGAIMLGRDKGTSQIMGWRGGPQNRRLSQFTQGARKDGTGGALHEERSGQENICHYL